MPEQNDPGRVYMPETPNPGPEFWEGRTGDGDIGKVCINLLGIIALGFVIVYMGKLYLANAEVLARHGEDDLILATIDSVIPDAWTIVGTAEAAESASVDVPYTTVRVGVCPPQ